MSGVRWWSLVWCTRISRRPRTPKARTKEFLTSFSVHVLRTRTIPIHTYTHTYRANTRPAHVETKERERLHIRVTTISWTYRRQTFGKETDGENESSSRGWMGLVTLMRRRQRNRGHLPYGYTHTHMCTQWGSDSQPPFEISSSRILYTLPSCHFLTHFSLHSSRSGEETETRVRSGVNFFFFLFLLFLSPWSWLMDWSIIFSSIRWAL